MRPRVSIIMTSRNAAVFIRETIEAIISQTFKEWELIFVNNQSTDNSLSLMKAYAKQDRRIKVYTNPGLAEIIPGLQYGFSKSSGALITRMDSDDIMPPDKLKIMEATMAHKGPGFIASGCIKHFSDTDLGDGFKKYDIWLNQLMVTNSNYREIYRECVIPSSCWMVYRNDFIRCGGFGRLVYPEDYDLCFRFYSKGLKIVGSSEILHLWRDHPARVSRTDKRYKDQLYYDLKLYYFKWLDWKKNTNLVLWGAGKKGKKLALKLAEQGFSFRWVCNNDNKTGHTIYGVKLEPIANLLPAEPVQVLIAVSAKEKDAIGDFLIRHNKPFFWFC